ncbi:hypothetical protein BaRGS_00013366, partial [Batillaria attramentaria]
SALLPLLKPPLPPTALSALTESSSESEAKNSCQRELLEALACMRMKASEDHWFRFNQREYIHSLTLTS